MRVLFVVRYLLLVQDLRKHHRESPPNPPTLGGVNLVPPRFGGIGGLLRKSYGYKDERVFFYKQLTTNNQVGGRSSSHA